MTALENIREMFEMCTVMAGALPDFECIYITKDVADALLDEVEAECAKLREQLQDAEHEESVAWDRVRSAERRNDKLRKLLTDFRNAMWRAGEWTEPFDERMRELGVEI